MFAEDCAIDDGGAYCILTMLFTSAMSCIWCVLKTPVSSEG
jgi:hypothetical protein